MHRYRRVPSAPATLLRSVADTAVLILAAWWGAWTSPFGLWVWTALCLSWIAHALMALRSVRSFVASLGTLLASRAVLAVGFGSLGPTVPVGAVTLAVLLPVAWWVALRPLVAAVPVRLRRGAVAFLGALVVLVAAAAGAAHATGRWHLLAAAVALLVSDLLEARQRFVQRTPVNDAVGLPLRYAALVLLAYPA